jgi:hypothetical protein
VTARRHDLICCPISDPRESALANVGLLEIIDPESGELFEIDTASKQTAEYFSARARTANEELDNCFKRLKTDALRLSTDRFFIDDVRRLFQKRQRRLRRG